MGVVGVLFVLFLFLFFSSPFYSWLSAWLVYD